MARMERQPEKTSTPENLPLSAVAKTLLLAEMQAQGVRQSELAQRIGATRQEVTRLTDLRHTTKIDTIELALFALGKRLHLTLTDA